MNADLRSLRAESERVYIQPPKDGGELVLKTSDPGFEDEKEPEGPERLKGSKGQEESETFEEPQGFGNLSGSG